MDEPVALVDLESDGSRFVARVLGREAPGVPHTHDWLRLQWAIESPFVSGSVEQVITPDDLEDWAAALDRLGAGGDASWLAESGRTPELRFRWVEAGEPVIEIEVDDGVMSGTRASVLVVVDPEWVVLLRARLAAVRDAWPVEAEESSPGAYRWRSGRPPG